jgi:hypothetical protein
MVSPCRGLGHLMTPYSMPLKEAALVQNLKMLLGVEAVALPIFVRHYSCPARF